MTPDYWTQACQTLSTRDPIMANLIAQYPDSRLSSRGTPFVTLLRSIVGQQISIKAAAAIWQRFITAFTLTPPSLRNQSLSALRQVGLSHRKAEYIHAVCDYFIHNDIDANYFKQHDDDSIIQSLSTIRGIGRWSAEMFLIFTLLRPNVFPVDDLGLLRALEKHYHGSRLTPALARRTYRPQFEPWCSVATWYLWRSLDPVEVQY